MKAEVLLLLFGFTANLFAQNQVGVTTTNVSAGSTNSEPAPLTSGFSITSRGPNNRIWQRTVTINNNAGGTVAITNSYTEIATGLHFWNGNQWTDANDQIRITPNGAVATNTQHQVQFAANINTAGAINLTTPNGQHMASHVLGLAYFDSNTSNSVLFAETQDSLGQLLPSGNQIIYTNAFTNAFTNVNCDLLYTHRLSGFEQDIVVREQLPPPTSFGLTGSNIWLQVWTEFTTAPAPQITQMQSGDSVLNFGAMKMGRGKAFLLGAASNGVPVVKDWVVTEGRTFLVESVLLKAISGAMAQLPAAGGSSGNSNSPASSGVGPQSKIGQTNRGFASIPPPHPNLKILKLPAPKLAKKGTGNIRLAETTANSIGLVLDYIITLANSTNFTFQGDTTYHVTGAVYLDGTTTIEGGTVVKFDPTSTSATVNPIYPSTSIGIFLSGSVACKTGPYRPAIFTAMDDDTVGTVLGGSTGNPNSSFYAVGLNLPMDSGTYVLNNLTFRYSEAGVLYWPSGGSLTLTDIQAYNCETFVSATAGYPNALVYLRNCLSVNIPLVLTSADVTYIAENLTVDNAYLFGNPNDGGGSFCYATNCIFANVSSYDSDLAIDGSYNCFYKYTAFGGNTFSASTSPFQSVGAGRHYLADNTYRSIGTASIDAALLAELPSLTTCPPYVYAATNLSNNLTLSPTAYRDTGSHPDLGYHYPAVDYAVGGVLLTNAVLTVNPGTVIAAFGTNGSAAGLTVGTGAQFLCQGKPNDLNHIIAYNTFQEDPTNIWSVPTNGLFRPNPSANSPASTIYCRFTDFSILALDAAHVYDTNGNTAPVNFRDCQFHGGTIYSTYATIDFTNCLMERVGATLWANDGNPPQIVNNLFRAGSMDLQFSSSNTLIQNNLFDQTTISDHGSTNYTGTFNGYLINSNHLSLTNAHDVFLGSSPIYQSGTLGYYYQPTNDSLFHSGNTNASLLSLYQYTTQTNQAKEGTNRVTIGYHYVSTDSAGNPVDSNGNGIPDYLEDTNGSGSASIVLTNPTNNASFSGPITLTIQASVFDWTVVTNVQFYRGLILIGTATNSPWQCTWTNAAPGIYGLTTVAYDTNGHAFTSAPVNITVSGPCSYTYSSNNSFGGTNGFLANLNYTNSSGSLQLNSQTAGFPFLNLPCKSSNTLLRLNTEATNFVGEYLTAPTGKPGYPGHAVVDRYGNTWVANWAEAGNHDGTTKGSITEIGIVIGGTRGYKTNLPGWTNIVGTNYLFVTNINGEYLQPPFIYSTAVDRDGDGLIHTSRGQGDVLPWPSNSLAGSVTDAVDECIVRYIRTPAQLVSALAVDTNNDLWVGGYCNNNSPDCPSNDTCYPHVHVKISGTTGLVQTNTENLFTTNGLSYGGFDALMGVNGVLWSSGGGNANANISLLNFDPGTGTTHITIDANNYFALAIDPQTSNMWVTAFRGSQVYVFSPSGGYKTNYYHGDICGGGLAIDNNGNVWVAHGPWLGSNSIGHLRTDGTLVGNVDISSYVGNNADTVVIDSNGKIWAICASTNSSPNLVRIDPKGGATNGGYTVGAVDYWLAVTNEGPRECYGDLTGQKLLAGTSPSGLWTVTDDSGEAGTPWNTLTWNASTLDTNQVKVEVRAADSSGQLATNNFQLVQNGVPLTNIMGEFLQVQVTLIQPAGIASGPSLHDLTVACASTDNLSVTLLTPTNGSQFGPDSSITMSATATPQSGHSISQIEFWQNVTNSLGIATTFPYQMTTPFLPIGTNYITAVATQNGGLTATSSIATVIVYARPTVTIWSPTNNSLFVGTTNLPIMAYATNIGVGISNVEFFFVTNSWGNGTKSGTNYVITTNLTPGVYPITAVATDSNGVKGYSSIVIYTVTSTNAPYVAITTPTNNSTFQANANITITAVATNGDNTITNVDFYSGAQWLGNATNSPYSILVCCWSPGDYSLTAVAKDSHGTSATSTNINIHVASDMPASGTAAFWDPTFNFPLITDDDGSPVDGDTVGELVAVSGKNLYLTYRNDDHTSGGLDKWDGSSWTTWSESDGTYPLLQTYGLVVDATNIYTLGFPDGFFPDGHTNWKAGVALGNGATWSNLGDELDGWQDWIYDLGVNGWPNAAELRPAALAMIGSDLYVGGGFTNSATHGTNVQYIAKLNRNNNTWESVGNGLNGPVLAIGSYGGHLVAGGGFTVAGGNSNCVHIAELIDNTWTNLGIGLTGPNANPGFQVVMTIASCGAKLYAGGDFTTADGNTNANGIAVWDGARWASMARGFVIDTNYHQGVHNTIYWISPRGNTVFVGGVFGGIWTDGTNQATAYNIAQATWSEALQDWTWSALDLGAWQQDKDNGPTGAIYGTAVLDGSSGNAYDLFVAGRLNAAGWALLANGGTPYANFARWTVGGVPEGSLPKVQITSPIGAGAVFTNATSISLVASVVVNNSNVSSVHFFDGDNDIGTASSNSSAIYTNPWVNPSTGVHLVKAAAYTTNGLPVQSGVVLISNKDSNNPIYMGDAFYKIPMNSPAVTLKVLTNDVSAGSLHITGLVHPNNALGTVTVSHDSTYLTYTPFTYTYGTDTFVYEVTNNLTGTFGASNLAAVTVQICSPPLIILTNPADGQSFDTNQNVTISGTASDYDGWVTNITLYVNGVNFGQTTNTNFSFTLNTNVADFYTLMAVATDNDGFTNASVPITIVVTNSGTASSLITADITNLPQTDNRLGGTIYPVVRQGLFDLQGDANDSNTGDAVSYQVLIYATDDMGALLANVTPGSLDANGFHSGRATNDLGILNLTGLPNGIYDLALVVHGGGRAAGVTNRFVLDTPLKIGQFSFSEQDMVLSATGIPITIVRTYNSLNSYSGDFGYDWTFAINSMDISLDEQRTPVTPGSPQFPYAGSASSSGLPTQTTIRTGGDRDITLTLPNGRRTTFVFNPLPGAFAYTAQWTAPPDVHATLAMNASSTAINLFPSLGWQDGVQGSSFDTYDVPGWTLTTQDGTRYNITRGQPSTVYYDPDEDGGHIYVQAYGPPTLSSIVQRTGDVLNISSSGITHTNLNGGGSKSALFQRDDSGRIIAIFDPTTGTNGFPALQYVYDQGTGNLLQVLKLQDRVAGTYTTNKYHYDNPNFPHYLTSMENPLGVPVARNEYDDQGRLTAVTDAYGNTTVFTHNISNNVEIVSDPLGNANSYVYDAQGNVITKTNALQQVTQVTYDANNNKLTDYNVALNATTSYGYDANSYLTATTNALGFTNLMIYDSHGSLWTNIDARGNVTTNSYDSSGNLLLAVNAYSTNTFAYDGNNRLFTSTNALGTTTSNSYDGIGNLTNVTLFDVNGSVISSVGYAYDDNGNRINQTIKRTVLGIGVVYDTTTYVYDAQNRLVETIDPLSNSNSVIYNAIGKQQATIDQLGRTNLFFYDDKGNLTNTTYPDGSAEVSVYNAVNERIISYNRLGYTNQYFYDALGRLYSTVFPDDTSNLTIYDAAGRVQFTVDARGTTNAFGYDLLSQQTAVTNGWGSTASNVMSYTYDENGNQVTTTDALGHSSTNVFDQLNRVTTNWFQDSTKIITVYDAQGQKIETIDQTNNPTLFGYDSQGRLTSVTNALNKPTHYAYDEAGNQTNQVDALDRTNTYFYDALGRRIRHTLPDTHSETFGYDGAGNQILQTNFNGVIITNQYDAMNRLTNRASAGGLLATYTFTTNGERATMVDPSGTYTYIYDVMDRQKTYITPQGTLFYQYDQNGNLTNITSSTTGGTLVGYQYDSLNRLTNVVDYRLSGTQNTSLGYDAVGNLHHTGYPNGVTNLYQYDTLNRLAALTWWTNGNTIVSFAYQLGTTGIRTGLTESLNGIRTYSWGYDSAYKLTSETIVSNTTTITLGYTYDDVGNRLTRTVTGFTGVGFLTNQTFTYDTNDWLTSDLYDRNGNTTSSLGTNFFYDAENRLTNVSVTNVSGAVVSSVSLVYNGDGQRVGKIVNGAATLYLLDTKNLTGYAQVLEEFQSDTNHLTRAYTYGLNLISQRLIDTSTNFFGMDGHGSVRFLTSKNGAITGTFTYDAYGTAVCSTGNTVNNYLYCGEQWDWDIGQYFLRARYMDPNTGRFRTMDTYEGDQEEDLSLHKYIYANQSPVDRSDPSGEDSDSFDSFVTISSGALFNYVRSGWFYPDVNKVNTPDPNSSRLTANQNVVILRHPQASMEAMFSELSSLHVQGAKASPPSVTGVGQDITWTLTPWTVNLGQWSFGVRCTKFVDNIGKTGPLDHYFVVATLEGHPLSGWRFWRVYKMPRENAITIETGAVEQPAGLLNSAKTFAMGDSAALAIWRSQMEDMIKISGGTQMSRDGSLEGRFRPYLKDKFLKIVQ